MTFEEAAMIMMSGGKTPKLINKTILENGIYISKDDNADGYEMVEVNVPTDANIRPLSITAAGSYTISAEPPYDGFNPVSVDVPDKYQDGWNTAEEYYSGGGGGKENDEYCLRVFVSSYVSRQPLAAHVYQKQSDGTWKSVYPWETWPTGNKDHCYITQITSIKKIANGAIISTLSYSISGKVYTDTITFEDYRLVGGNWFLTDSVPT